VNRPAADRRGPAPRLLMTVRQAGLALSLMASPLALAATPPTSPVPAAEVQSFVHGVVREAVRFREGDTTLTLVLSETGRYTETPERLHARLYATLLEGTPAGDGLQERWRIADHVLDCPLDLTLRYTRPAFHLSDADQDGTLEIWVSYYQSCRGDVSPSTLKLIGYEGNQKLAMRGSATLVLDVDGETFTQAGERPPVMDAALQRSPALRAKAQALWQLVERETLSD
jgi:hypothetical protein